MKKYASQIEALSEIIRMSANAARAVSWADLSRARRLASHFGITPDDVFTVCGWDRGWTAEYLEAWLNEHKPKKVKNATI